MENHPSQNRKQNSLLSVVNTDDTLSIVRRVSDEEKKFYNFGESYNKTTYDYDYAIFELEEPVNINDRIEPVCFPDLEDSQQERILIA
jgi:hypothetical protein